MRRPITATKRRRLAVLGSPIAHSKSPALHGAAYAALGLDWSYEAIEVSGNELAEFVASRDESWRGLSLTMPLKREVLPLLDSADDMVDLTGAANTVLLGESIRGFNTDVYGITEAFRAHGVSSLARVQILGGGATAASALVAAKQLGAHTVTVSLRDQSKAAGLVALGALLDVTIAVLSEPAEPPDAVISTLPGSAKHSLSFAAETRASAVLFDVAYDPWPSQLAREWLAVDGQVISGIEMLTLQALAQVRVFVNGDPASALANEQAVVAAMQRAVAG